jgi:phosphatidate cytidylyltransferase
VSRVPDRASQAGTEPRQSQGDGRIGNLALRIFSALVMAPIAIGAVWIGSWLFAVFWLGAALLVLWEWIHLVAGPRHMLMFSASASALAVAALVEFRERPITAMLLIVLGAIASLVFAQRRDRLWVTAGIAYAGAMLLAPMFLRADPDYGLFALLLLFAVVWTTDIMAYFTGRAVGGPKLCAAISPKKTWSGAIGGTVCATAIAVVLPRILGAVAPGEFAVAAKLVHPGVLVLLGVILSVLAQLGDLLESWIKRHFGAKDASHLIPGHGGVMDRLDGFWAAAVAACLIGLVHGGLSNAALGLLIW